MKDEIRDEIAFYHSADAVSAKIDDWIDYYNNDRYQWELLKLSPAEYYTYLQTGVYPLPTYQARKASDKKSVTESPAQAAALPTRPR